MCLLGRIESLGTGSSVTFNRGRAAKKKRKAPGPARTQLVPVEPSPIPPVVAAAVHATEEILKQLLAVSEREREWAMKIGPAPYPLPWNAPAPQTPGPARGEESVVKDDMQREQDVQTASPSRGREKKLQRMVKRG